MNISIFDEEGKNTVPGQKIGLYICSLLMFIVAGLFVLVFPALAVTVGEARVNSLISNQGYVRLTPSLGSQPMYTIYCSSSINTDTVKNGSVELIEKVTGNSVKIRLNTSLSGAIRVIPEESLVAGKSYYIIVNNNIEDSNGHNLKQGAVVEIAIKSIYENLKETDRVYGSNNPNSPQSYSGNVGITSPYITLQNATIAGNLYVAGNNVILKNIKVTGSLIMDPGVLSSDSIENVTAGGIEVRSGTDILMKDVTTKSLLVKSLSEVMVKISGKTTISKTQVQFMDADIGLQITEAQATETTTASFGPIDIIERDARSDRTLEMEGVFKNTLTVHKPVTVKVNSGKLAKMEIYIIYREPVRFSGECALIDIQTPALFFFDSGKVDVLNVSSRRVEISSADGANFTTIQENGNEPVVSKQPGQLELMPDYSFNVGLAIFSGQFTGRTTYSGLKVELWNDTTDQRVGTANIESDGKFTITSFQTSLALSWTYCVVDTQGNTVKAAMQINPQ